MADIARHHRLNIAWASFVILVVALPLAFGIAWVDHQRDEEVAQIVEDRRATLIDGCVRGNAIRERLNALILDHPHPERIPPLPIIDCEATIR